MASYAQNTGVSVERSRAEIETIVKRYGASKFANGWDGEGATILFEMKNRRVRFDVPIPPLEEFRKMVKWGKERELPDGEAQKLHDQEIRRRFRALLLIIKAKLEAVESNITTFEEEFLAHIVLPGGQTVGEWLTPQIETSYEKGKLPPLLPR